MAYGSINVDSTVTSWSDTTGGLYGFKNRIINGAMMISQRGTSFSAPSSANYNLDRWFATWTGAAPASISQVAGIGNYSKAIQITGAASNALVYFAQRIESNNCSDLYGQTVTIQATIAVSSPQNVIWSLAYPTAQDNYTSLGSITGGTGTWSATTTATTFTATIPSLPSGALNGLQLLISPNNGGAFTSGTITITGVQLEKGSTATSFDYRPYGTELQLCQRYYYRNSGSGYWPFAMANGYTTTAAYNYISFPVPMRTTPSLPDYSAANTFIFLGGVSPVPTALAFNAASYTGANISFTGTFVSGTAYLLTSNASAAAYLGFSAEL